MDNINDSGSKNIRGRFVIQEIIEPKETDEEIIIEEKKLPSQSQFNLNNLVYKDPIISRELFRKRRNSFNNSKFKLNSKNSLENEITTKFLVYDFLTKSYVDINRIFHKYNDKFVFHKNLFKRNSNKKRSIHFTQFYQKNSKIVPVSQLNLPLIKNEFKRTETVGNLHRSLSINSDNEKHGNFTKNFIPVVTKAKHNSTINSKNNVNVNIFPKKNLFHQFQRFLSISDKNDILVEQRVFTFAIESQNFKECSIKDCQFSL